MAGGGIIVLGTTLIPLLSTLFTGVRHGISHRLADRLAKGAAD